MLNTAAIREGVARIHARIGSLREVLDAADRQLGDGDTGMTVAQIVAAWAAIADSLPADVGGALAMLGRETSRASGSSLGAVMAMGLSAAAKQSRGREALSPTELPALFEAAASAITERSGASAGDKTVLDSLLAIGSALAGPGPDEGALAVAVSSARQALDSFRGRPSRLGRARIFAGISVGLDDPGMLAAMLLLEAAAGG